MSSIEYNEGDVMTVFKRAYESPQSPTIFVAFCDTCAEVRTFRTAEERDRFERHEHDS